MIQPVEKKKCEKGPLADRQANVHINEHDAQRPDIGGTGGVSRGNIISAF